MTEHDFHEISNMYPNLNVIPLSATPLSDQHQFRLSKINDLKDFVAENIERKLMRKKLSKYIAFLIILISH